MAAASSLCSSPTVYPVLTAGGHTFQVRTTDQAGNVGQPASYAWTIDTAAPVIVLTSPPNGGSSTNLPTFTGTAGAAANDSTTVTVKVYPGPSANGTPVQTLTTTAQAGGAYSVVASSGLASGTYTARAEQLDGAGNLGLSSANTFSTTDAVLVAAGDIADCGLDGDEKTAALVSAIPEAVVAPLGDLVYDFGTVAAFNNCYHPTWGAFKNRTRPVLGGHDYTAANQAPGYVTYFANQLAPFGAAASDPVRGWYSYDLGSWHVAVVNSSCGTDASACNETTQEQWLRADLAASASSCQVVMFHNARYSSGAIHGDTPNSQKYWAAAYDGGADLVLNGHEHGYERFAPMDSAGNLDTAYGVREILVGTGGASHYSAGTIKPNSQVRNYDTFGILKLTLHSGGYDWQFIPEAGKTFTDSGSGTCHGVPPPPPAPIPNVRAASSNSGNSAASITISKPVGTQQGDLILGTLAWQNGVNRNIAPPSGWTAVPNTDYTDGNNVRIRAFYHFAGPSEPSSYTFTITGGAGPDLAGGLISISGANASPIDASGGQVNTASSKNVTAPSITTASTYRLLVYAGAINQSTSFTPPGLMTEQYDVKTTGQYKVSLEGATQGLTSSGATGGRTGMAFTSGRGVALLIAIRPQ